MSFLHFIYLLRPLIVASEITKDNGEAYRASYGDNSPGMKGGRGGHQQQMSGRNPQQRDYYQSGAGGGRTNAQQQDSYYDQPQQGRRPNQQSVRGRGVGQQQTRIFVALFDYDPPTMSPNPDACEEELPFREGQLIKVHLQIAFLFKKKKITF